MSALSSSLGLTFESSNVIVVTAEAFLTATLPASPTSDFLPTTTPFNSPPSTFSLIIISSSQNATSSVPSTPSSTSPLTSTDSFTSASTSISTTSRIRTISSSLPPSPLPSNAKSINPTSPSPTRLAAGAIAGIVIGALVFVVLKAGCMFWVGTKYRHYRRRRALRKTGSTEKHRGSSSNSADSIGSQQELDSREKELDPELEGYRVPRGEEMDTEHAPRHSYTRGRAKVVTDERQELPGDWDDAVQEVDGRGPWTREATPRGSGATTPAGEVWRFRPSQDAWRGDRLDVADTASQHEIERIRERVLATLSENVARREK